MRALLCLTSYVQSTLTARTSLQSCIRHACVQGPHTALIADPRMLRQSLINNRSFAVFAIHHSIDASYVALRDLPALVTVPLQARLSATNPQRAISSSAAESSMPTMLDLGDKDKSLVKLFLAASSHQWHLLPGRCLCLLESVMHGNCSGLQQQIMLGLQSLGELAMNMAAVLHISVAVSDTSLCKFQRSLGVAAAELQHPWSNLRFNTASGLPAVWLGMHLP